MARKKLKGGFRELSNGTIEYQVSLPPDIYGKRRRKAFYGKDDYECIAKYQEFIKNGHKQPDKPKVHTLSTTLDEWIEERRGCVSSNTLSSSTLKDYCFLIVHIKKHGIGSMRLADIKRKHITDFFMSIGEYSNSARKKTRYILSAAFEWAIDNEDCINNPVRNFKLPPKLQPEKEPFTEDETRIILDFAKTDYLFGLPITIMLNSGIRSGEMRALSPSQIDLKNGVITVDRAIKHTEELGKPKNNKTRYVPLDEEVTAFLAENVDKKAKYLVGNTHYVSRAGFRSRYLHFFNRMNKYLADSGKEPIPFKSAHATRHTYSTLRQKQGMPIAMVAELLGHCSTAVTDKYTHFKDVSILSEAVRKYAFLPPPSPLPTEQISGTDQSG
jgi:integrase